MHLDSTGNKGGSVCFLFVLKGRFWVKIKQPAAGKNPAYEVNIMSIVNGNPELFEHSEIEEKKRGGELHKRMIRALGKLIETGSLQVSFWDGTEETYGTGRPCLRLVINDRSVVGRLVKNPALAFGEAYVDGAIDFEGSLDDAIQLVHLNQKIIQKFSSVKVGHKAVSKLRRLMKSSIENEKTDVQHHYDLGNDFFALWLDPTMSYSCAYFKTPQDTLEQAQIQKIDHSLKKLQLKPGEALLDIGSGWGWLIIRAAQLYGVKAVGITVSEEQYRKTQERVKEFNLEHLVEVLLMDYRELAKTGRKFDKIVSIGMFEHVTRAGLPLYMAAVRDMLKPGGLSLLHTITHRVEAPPNPWILKYIFPCGYIPSLRETVWLLPEYDFNLLDVECLRMHYAMTLDRWAENYESKVDLVRKNYGERFVRMWRMYLQSSAASFRHSGLSVNQLLFSKGLNNNLPLIRDYS